jgi:hypothetical protein
MNGSSDRVWHCVHMVRAQGDGKRDQLLVTVVRDSPTSLPVSIRILRVQLRPMSDAQRAVTVTTK